MITLTDECSNTSVCAHICHSVSVMCVCVCSLTCSQFTLSSTKIYICCSVCFNFLLCISTSTYIYAFFPNLFEPKFLLLFDYLFAAVYFVCCFSTNVSEKTSSSFPSPVAWHCVSCCCCKSKSKKKKKLFLC